MLVDSDHLLHGDVPRICVKTGAPADGTVRASFSRLPAWTYLLLIAGVLPFLIALVFARERVEGQVPVTRGVVARYHRLSRWGLACWGAAAVLGVGAVVGPDGLWIPAGAALVAVAVLWFRRAVGWVDARPVPATGHVELRRVSQTFADAVAHTRLSGG